MTAVGMYSIWGGDMFPAGQDPKGKPEEWTREEMRRWLAAVRLLVALPALIATNCVPGPPEGVWLTVSQRDLHPQDSDGREQLLERINANLRIPRKTNK